MVIYLSAEAADRDHGTVDEVTFPQRFELHHTQFRSQKLRAVRNILQKLLEHFRAAGSHRKQRISTDTE